MSDQNLLANTTATAHEQPKLFIAWSGKLGKVFAENLRDSILGLCMSHLDKDDIFLSSDPDVNQSSKGFRETVESNLSQTTYLLIFITKETLARKASWPMYEAGYVSVKRGGTVVLPILVGLNNYECDEFRKGPLGYVQYEIWPPNPGAEIKLVDRIFNKLAVAGIIPRKELQGTKSQAEQLIKNWNNALESLVPHAEAVISRLTSDTAFERWADEFHFVYHWGRHACIHAFERGSSLSNTAGRWQSRLAELEEGEEHPPSHPGLDQPRMRVVISVMLRHMHEAFAKVVNVADPNEDLWVCFRDLRSGGAYHTYHRTPEKAGSEVSVPWHPDEVPLIGRLLSETSAQKCVVTANSDLIPPPHRDRTKQVPATMIVGAVMAKQSGNADPLKMKQAGLVGILCVSSATPNVFSLPHERLLQGCNDMFSAIMNIILRAAE